MRINLLIWQVLLMPEGIENPAAAGKANAQNPRKVPHGVRPQYRLVEFSPTMLAVTVPRISRNTIMV
jgi:hypothetical protein